ncbi:MAG: enoyl-CoA hydratase/isomerase family protein [Pseudomonadota bacterium]
MLESEKQTDGVLRISLARPEVRNAFDDYLIAELTRELEAAREDKAVRAVLLTGQGEAFSAGADLNWMRRMADYTEEENLEDARRLAKLMHVLNSFPRPTVALVNGPALGGGVGLVACCDIAIAADTAFFALSEVRLGLIPSAISPFVIRAIGAGAARRYFVTGERFGAAEARRIGLVHKVVAAGDLEKAGEEMCGALLKGGPNAIAAAKDLIFAVDGAPLGPDLFEETAARIARVRSSDEGKEGVTAFLQKRKADWVQE